MKRLLALLLLVAAPLLGQTPTPTPTVTPTVTPTRTPTVTPTPTPTPVLPSRYSLAQQVRPGFGTFQTEGTVNLLGDTYYATDYRTFGRVAGNTTTTRKFWRQVGTGSASAAPAWDTLIAGDIPSLAASIITSGTIATARLGSGTANSTTFLRGDQTWQALSGAVSSISTTAPITGCSSPCTGTATLGITSFNTTAPSPGAVPDATGAGAGTYLDKSGNWTTPAGAVTSPLTTKGDLWGYSTGDTRKPVGPDGTLLTADSSQATGLKYKYLSTAFMGGNVFTWSFQARTSGTVYQNTASYPMLLMVAGTSTGTGNVEILSDASNPPTTSRAKTSNSNGLGANVIAWVLPSHYYKIVATSVTLLNAAEYVFTKGTLVDSGNLSGSKSLGTVYQNTSGATRFVGVEVGTSGSATCVTDSANPPTTNTMAAGINSGVGVTLFCPVLDQHYYKVVQGGSASIVKWYEWDLSGVTVTKSVSLASRVVQSSGTPTAAFWNVSGKSLLALYSGHNSATNSIIVRAEPVTGFSAVSPQTSANSPSFFSATLNIIRPVYVAVNPGEAYLLYMDAGTVTNDTFFEFTLE